MQCLLDGTEHMLQTDWMHLYFFICPCCPSHKLDLLNRYVSYVVRDVRDVLSISERRNNWSRVDLSRTLCLWTMLPALIEASLCRAAFFWPSQEQWPIQIETTARRSFRSPTCVPFFTHVCFKDSCGMPSSMSNITMQVHNQENEKRNY